MGWLDKLTGNTPEVQRAVEETKKRLKAEGDAISNRIAQESQQRRAAVNRDHTTRMSALDQEIAQTKQGMENNRKQFAIDQAFRGLETEITMSLVSGLVRSSVPDPRSAMESMRSEIQQKVALLKQDVHSESVAAVETWALSKVGNDEKASNKLREAFQTFRQKLQGIMN